MGFKTPITITEALDNIQTRRYLLPSIQRELVWGPDRITVLFDSLMRGYPIGSFLFWKVKDDQKNEFQFYEFIREYHEKDNKHNPKANISGTGEITGILDGQQRLEALYIGLKGSYANKLPRKRWNESASFPKRELYLNLLSEADNFDLKYDFRFLTKEEVNSVDEKTRWFKVGKILEFGASDPSKIWTYLVENGLAQSVFAGQTLFKLHEVIHKALIINYFEDEEQDLDKVLQIFVRVNSQGVSLSYSDLLLSIATSQWKEVDAREEILSFVDEINNIKDGFQFDKDFVLKSCLVMADFQDIAFKVTNFNKTNMNRIEETWDDLSKAIRLAVRLAADFGFNGTTLISNYALIPVAYYLYLLKMDDRILLHSDFSEERKTIKKWLILSLLKQTFGGQPDNVLRPIRNVIKDHHTSFPLEQIREALRTTNRPIQFENDDIWDLIGNRYGGRYTFLVLSLLYPTLDYRNLFHQDHIFPKSLFKSAKSLMAKCVPIEQTNFYLENFNYMGNLQLLEGQPNQEKSNKEFKDWFEANCPTEVSKSDYRGKNMIPNLDLDFNNFEEFFEKREDIIFEKLKEVLK